MRAALIGAGDESLHTIEKARQLGVSVTALDGNPRAAGLSAADEGLAVDISDEEAVLTALRARKPDFLITGPIGRYLTTVGAVNDALQLTGISRQAAVLCTDKYLFHTTLAQKGLRSCACELVPSGCGKDAAQRLAIVDNLTQKAETLAYPVILKPRYGSGSRGIFFLEDAAAVRGALSELYGVVAADGADASAGAGLSGGAYREPVHRESVHMEPADEDYVLEEAVGGVEYGVDGAMDGDAFRLILLRRKLLTPPPARQAVGYLTVQGGDVSEQKLPARVQEHLAEVTEALGLRDCLLHADLMIEADEIFVIELSARPSGHNLHNLFTPMATGVDMAENYIRSRCGMEYSYRPLYTRPLLIRYFDLPEGTVVSVPAQTDIRLPEGVALRAWKCSIRPGDRLGAVTTGHSVMGRGYFILEGKDKETLGRAADGVKGLFEVRD